MHYWGWGFGWWIGGMIMMVLFWIVVVVGILALTKWLFGQGQPGRISHPQGKESFESALEILRKRYARGEITKDEFENMKKDIE